MLTINQPHFKYFLYLLVPLVLFFSACSREEEPEPETNELHEAFYDEMKNWYLWNDQIPDIDPSSYATLEEVLEAIRFLPIDRWSFITEWEPYWAYINNSEFVGHGFGHKFDEQGNLRVTFVYNSSSLYTAGVKRGWIIQAVNGVTVTPTTQISPLFGENVAGVSNTIRFLKPDGEIHEEAFTKQVIILNQVLHHSVIDQQGVKIGYLVLQGFTGTAVEEIRQAFADFRQEGISELILDLRYNGGGLVDVSKELTSLIGGALVSGKPFIRYVYNDVQSRDQNREVNFSNEPDALNMTRLVTIATRSSASASELVINGLRPYMDVTIVGDRTYGKPVGANIFRFNQEWAMVPITFTIFNADDEGEYYDGLEADIPALDGVAYEFGDLREASLQQAVAFIMGGSITKSAPLTENPYNQLHEQKWGLRKMIGAW